jgi:hypothetical protein
MPPLRPHLRVVLRGRVAVGLSFPGGRHVFETPQCLALVLCDHVYHDSQSGKYSILGTFDVLPVQSFPATVQFAVYFALTGGRGECRIKLLVSRVDSLMDDELDAVSFELPMFRINDPVATIQVCLTATGVCNASGAYNCALLANDEQIAMRRLTLVEASWQ